MFSHVTKIYDLFRYNRIYLFRTEIERSTEFGHRPSRFSPLRFDDSFPLLHTTTMQFLPTPSPLAGRCGARRAAGGVEIMETSGTAR